jgi:hypothetical protein
VENETDDPIADIIALCKRAVDTYAYDHPNRVMLPDMILRRLGEPSVYDEEDAA